MTGISDAILITGAGGRIGRALARRWAERSCILLDREEGDLTAYDAGWTDRFAGIGTVVHLAADPNPDGGFDSATHANTAMTLNMIRASLQHGVGRIIYASSVWARYEAWRLASRMTWYAASKVAGEALVRAWSDQTGKPAVCLRFGYFDVDVPLAPPGNENHRLNEAALGFHADEALAWPGPGCSVRYAIGKL